MFRSTSMLAAVALLLSADVSGVLRTPSASEPVHFAADETLPVFPDTSKSGEQGQPNQDDSTNHPGQPAKAQNGPLQPASRLTLIRFVDGEFARVVQPIPAGKKGFHLKVGSPLDQRALRMALASSGSAINPGDQARITSLEFKDRQVVVDINGGGKGKTRLRDRIHLEVDGGPMMSPVASTGGPSVNTNPGATLYLDFDKSLPDMTPDDLKQHLSALLDFSKQHSAAVQWVDTLPPEIRQAIQDKKAVVGMDHEMVLAAIGRPDRKVREKGPDGNEIEDWIYGKPPAKTIFVSFEGDKVTQVQQFPQ
ncbi:MAG TPA: hypothetical protein VGT24_08050 [Candidatus Acidoferrales bacterium]|nr:hypothetical protein [Candidatus Acidoferrales bacterium]